MNENSKWIWHSGITEADQYAEFYNTFNFSGEKAEINISADSNYAIYINGSFVNSGQYPDFPHYKVYDKIDISSYCKAGKNHLAIIVWYYGQSNMSYYLGKAALRYEICLNGETVVFSDENTLSRISRTYRNGYKKIITGQLGFSFWYDLTCEDNWMIGELEGFSSSVTVEQNLPMYIRPTYKYRVGAPLKSKLVKQDDGRHFLFDLGAESVGYLAFSLSSSVKQKIKFCYGEHILDGGVRYIIDGRDFSVECTLNKGKSRYTNPFRRLGLRYLEIFAEYPIEVEYATVLPTEYPLNRKEKAFEDSLRQDIYNVAVRTLQLCMHDHYEDTPWREQALYALDSRNQMLFGYYAFGEYRFPRANLLLLSKDNREDGLLSICVPSADNLTIPSFSLHYFTSVYEYTVYSGDKTLIEEIYPKLESIINTFINRMKNGLLPNFTEKCHWNFYEWSEGLSGDCRNEGEESFDAALNCLFASALDTMHKITEMLGYQNDYLSLKNKVNAEIRHCFMDIDGLFVNSVSDNRKSELVNSLAILCGAAEAETTLKITEKLTENNSALTGVTLSMLGFKYDALLKTDREKYKDYILADIDVRYKKMLDAGATSFWETELGEKDFHNAGSLCHGWSSIPVYYYSILIY